MPTVVSATFVRALVSACLVASMTVACTGDDSHGSDDHGDTSAAAGGDACFELIAVPCELRRSLASVPVAGSSFLLVYASDRVPGRSAKPTADITSAGLGGWSLSVHHIYTPSTHVLLLGDGTRRTVDAIKHDGKLVVASRDAKEAYEFDADGRHLRTVEATSGAVERVFGYDNDGRLTSVTDRDEGQLKIVRNGNGGPTAIETRGFARTVLTVGSDRLLSGVVTESRGDQFTYRKGSLLSTWTGADGTVTRYSYDAQGRLTQAVGASGTRRYASSGPSGAAVTMTIGGRDTTTAIVKNADGSTTWRLDRMDGTSVTERVNGEVHELTLADGTKATVRTKEDPRFGAQSRYVADLTSSGRGGHYVIDKRADGDILKPTSWSVSVDDGNGAEVITWDAARHELTHALPSGRKSVTTTDDNGRPVKVVQPGRPVVEIARDPDGIARQIVETSDGKTVTTTVTRKPGSPVITLDRAGQKAEIAFDQRGNPVSMTGPDGRVVSLSTQGDAVETRVDEEIVSTTTASATGITFNIPAGNDATRTYSARTATDGTLPATGGWDSAGPLSTTVQPDDAGRAGRITDGDLTIAMTYASGRLAATTADGTRWAADDGVFGGTWTGLIGSAQAVDFDYRGGRPVAVTVAGVRDEIAYGKDGELTRFGPVSMTAQESGFDATRTVAGATTTFAPDASGGVATQTLRVAGHTVSTTQITRDVVGRITKRAQTVGATSTSEAYRYDKAGRLAAATRDGATTRYTWGSRDGLQDVGGTRSRTFTTNALNQVTAVDDARYTWGANMALRSRRDGSGTTTYTTTGSGDLHAVTLADGTRIDYVLDGAERRVGRKVNGQLTDAWIYYDSLHPAAQLAADGSVAARFTWADDGTLAAMRKNGRTYAVVTDQIGSPHLVVDANSGDVVQRIDYDALGAITRDTNPGFQPFGFAGGIADRATGLVHLGARDYDPVIGRFIAADPALGAGSPTNLYAYSAGDPINHRDVTGTEPTPEQWAGFWNFLGNFGNVATVLLAAAAVHPTASAGLLGTPLAGVGAPIAALGFVKNAIGTSQAIHDISQNGLNHENLGNLLQGIAGTVSGGAGLLAPLALNAALGASVTVGLLSGIGLAAAVVGLVGYLIQQNDPGLTIFTLLGASGAAFGYLVAGAFGFALGPAILIGLGIGLLLGLLGAFAVADPHMITADGATYSFQGVGEYYAATDRKGGVEVQVRQEPYGLSRSVAVTTAVAMRLGTDRAAVYLDRTPALTVNGVPAELPVATQRTLPGGGKVARDVNGVYYLVAADGKSGAVVNGAGSSYLDVQIRGDKATLRTMRGTYGRPDGDPANEWTMADGRVLTMGPDRQRPAWTRLHRQFGESWRVPLDKSLFDGSPRTVADRGFPYRFVSVATLATAARDRATAACRAAGVLTEPYLSHCILDVGATGNLAFATGASAAQARGSVVAVRSGRPATPPAPTPSIPISATFTIRIGDRVSPGQPAADAGTIAAGEAHQYDFAATTDSVVFIDGGGSGCTRGVAHYELYRPDGARTFAGADACDDLGRQTLDRDGTWSIRVFADRGGEFSFGVRAVSDATGPTLALGDARSGSITAAGARRTYKIPNLADGQVIYLEGANSSSCVRGKVGYELLTPDKSRAYFGADTCDNAGRYAVDEAGTWSVVVSGADGGRKTGQYRFRVYGVTDRSETMSIGDTRSGVLDAVGAIHIYRFSGRAGQVIYLEGSSDGAGARGLTRYTLHEPDGSSTYVGSDTCCAAGRYTLDTAGTWSVRVEGQANRHSVGPYRFHIYPVTDRNETISLGDSRSGSLTSLGQFHTYSFSATAGQAIVLRGNSDPSCERGHVAYELREPDGSKSYFGADTCLDAGRFVLRESGKWTVRVYGANNGQETGSYRFQLGRG